MEIIVIGTLYVGILVYLVNVQTAEKEHNPLVMPMLYILPTMLVVFGFFFFLLTMQPADVQEALDAPRVSTTYGGFTLGISLTAATLSYAMIQSKGLRNALKQIAGAKSRFDPDSMLHRVAVVLAVVAFAWILMNFIMIGGTSGLAESLSVQPPTTNETLFEAIVYVMLALLGVGLFIRRMPEDVLVRLGLRFPTLDDARFGLTLGAGLYIFSVVSVGLWEVIANPEAIEAQSAASEQIFDAFSGTLVSGFILAAAAAIGEEILFRGALQPVFGMGLTTLYFVLLHQQYLLTPIMLIIFGVGWGFAWLRNRHSTTAAIIAHFVYNFAPFFLINLLGPSLSP